MLHSSEITTLQGAREANSALIVQLFDQHHGDVFRYLFYLVKDAHTAEDLTSEVFLRMIRFFQENQLEGSTYKSWLFRIAHNLAIDYYRKPSTKHNVDLVEDLQASDPDLETTVGRRLTSESLVEALSRLNPYQREVIVLRFVVRMPVAEVALSLNKTEDTVKGLQRRGLAALRKILDDSEVAYA